MNLNEHIKNERLQEVEHHWQHLAQWQKWHVRLVIVIFKLRRLLIKLYTLPLSALNRHIALRRARFAYLYQAHWVKRKV
jgi:hypothetical protein